MLKSHYLSFCWHLLSTNWSIIHFTIGLEIFFRNQFWGQIAPKLNKTTFYEEIQTLIVEYIIYQYLLTMCQKKRFDQGYDNHKGFLSK